ncbi:hypothetical protein LMG31506_03851 [Cupriavidus yeoncheonensis]|uniref:Serine aminopeptidase S33 domain-containing protein n=1 Tax=Cupriavidus yeoncheonensis TaxID=1462994 RepID=A0A916IXF6_9BURK|nr:alpha/beta hydrolase [Cupriavidus yeoncheonensis]CAG2148563.1 hypothetical protein LMG31506_03851 [Cupriavidus yeoncheonensis]
MKALLAVLVLGLSVPAGAQDAAALEESVSTVAVPGGSELSVVVSKQPGSKPAVAALLFPGYPGVLRVQSDAGKPTYQLRGNFLVRARRHLVSDKILTVMVDCPKARWENCDDAYRTSDQHVQDMGAVIDKVKADYGVSKIYVVGTSYGTVSSAFLALRLGGRIDGAVHTSTFTDPRFGRLAHGMPMRDFKWTAVTVDQLFVHHKDDPCPLTQYRSIVARKGNAPLVTVQGSKGARGEPCEAFSAHGFVGRERPVMLAISDWILERKVQETVGADSSED